MLLCGRHHRLIHHSDWDVAMGADGHPVFHPPPWLHPDITMTNPTWRTRINTDHHRRTTRHQLTAAAGALRHPRIVHACAP